MQRTVEITGPLELAGAGLLSALLLTAVNWGKLPSLSAPQGLIRYAAKGFGVKRDYI